MKLRARPPFAAERLSLTPDGRVLHKLRRAWRDGTTHVVFEPLVFLERLAALVPADRWDEKASLRRGVPSGLQIKYGLEAQEGG